MRPLAHRSLDNHLLVGVLFPLFLFVEYMCGRRGWRGGEPLKSWLSMSTSISDRKDRSNPWAARQCLMTGPTSRSFWSYSSAVHLDEGQDRPNDPTSYFVEEGVRIKFLAETPLKKTMKKTKVVFVTPHPSAGLSSPEALCSEPY